MDRITAQIGDIRRLKYNRQWGTYQIWAACVDCGRERWVNRKQGQPVSRRCRKCARLLSRPARWRNNYGYIYIRMPLHSPFTGMATAGNLVLEHRLIMAQHLGRPLAAAEKVHHRNGVKDDNRIENLELLSPAAHLIKEFYCHQCSLQKEIRLLRWQVKELLGHIQGAFPCNE